MLFQFRNPILFLLFIPLAAFCLNSIRLGLKRPATRSYFKLFLLTFAFSLCILALTRPQVGHQSSQTHAARGQLFVAFDVSKSMLAQDTPPSRLEFGINFLDQLLQRMPSGTKVSLFPFALNGYTLIPLTFDLNAVIEMADTLNPNLILNQGTNLNRSLETLIRLIHQMEAKANAEGNPWYPTQVLILSDGETHSPVQSTTLDAFRNSHIPIFTVGIGTTTGSTIPGERRSVFDKESMHDSDGRPVITKLDATTLKKISDDTRGEYFPGHFAQIDPVNRRIGRSLELAKVSVDFKVDRELFPFLLLLACLCLIADLTLGQWEYALRTIFFVTAALASGLGSPQTAHAEEPSPSVSPTVQNMIDAESNPNRRAVRQFNEGLRLLKENNMLKASEFFHDAASTTKDPEVRKKSLYNMGNALLKHGDPLQALDAYQQAFDIKLGKSSSNDEINKRVSENMVLATRQMEEMKSQSNSQGSSNDDADNKSASQDRKGPEQYKDQNLSNEQKQRIFDLVAAEEQQSIQRIQEERNKGNVGEITTKPW